MRDTKEWSLNRRGTYVFNTRPSDAELERRFPADAWDDPSRWDMSGLEPYLQRFDINFHPDYLIDIPRPTMALWIGDNWRVDEQPDDQPRRALRRRLGRDRPARRDRDRAS